MCAQNAFAASVNMCVGVWTLSQSEWRSSISINIMMESVDGVTFKTNLDRELHNIVQYKKIIYTYIKNRHIFEHHIHNIEKSNITSL